jgi:predicted acylesterase/phospholipase RssA
MTIKHIVISGGGPTLIQSLAAIQRLESSGLLEMNNIKSIYGTSAGAIVGTLISLKYDWETINDYIIKRPWQDVFPIKVQNIFDAYTKRGIFDSKTVEKCFKPLFDAKDIPLDITLEAFYEYSNIDLHFFTFDINDYKIHNVSHLTHPGLQLMVALQMTCALPILISPVCLDGGCYIDGGISCNYPLHYCIESGNDPDEILGIKNNYSNEKSSINADSTLLDFLLSFLYKAIFSVSTDKNQPEIKYELVCESKYMSLSFLKDALSSVEVRKILFSEGTESAVSLLDRLSLENGVQELSQSAP